ncbi:thioredoxin-disulfide reductase [Candidatus Cerribacteria bacterium 'Amazon FNV 2010 28 9']|uniref:Thioredoxin reductase n=1 Tax=Candidatus Cerribacteria bacterium 'Amazon FNV 2010 28 9' TaxID=2081795 RepID=A0A317JN79_9BACT|nr:MAG: thioredoxin-disulfide reductase [Candidatus Cerribacteria bacterium 'Amazon FNV 2010 28 9']
MNEIHNTIIIGSGPAGWTAAIYLARAGLSPLVLAGEQNGGQLMLTTVIENFPGFPEGVDGPTLMMNMRAQAQKFGTQIIDKTVTKMDVTAQPFKVWVGEQTYEAQSILIATGAESVWLGAKGESEFIGRGVSTCAVCDAAFFKGKTTFVVGGGDAAMEDALALTKFAKSVTLIHRRDSFKASKIMQERVLNNPSVHVMWNSAVSEIKGSEHVTSIVVEDVNTHTTQELPADGVFVAIGHKPSSSFCAGAIALDDKGFILTRLGFEKASVELASSHIEESTFVAYPTHTSVEGVFAAGDCVDFRYKQAITASGFGCMAALDIEKWLEEKSSV